MGESGTSSALAVMKSIASRRALNSKHALFLLVVAVVWSSCASPVLSNGDRSTSVVYPLVPRSGTFAPDERLALWQLPEGPVEKVLVIFHGRDDYPTSYWDYSPSCLTCTGSPEKRRIVADALSRNYAVFMPCSPSEWVSWPQDSLDVLSCKDAISEWKNLLGLQGLPTRGIGFSAGGEMVGTLALHPGIFDAICLMVSSAKHQIMEACTSQYPPTMFINMPRDRKTSSRIHSLRRALETKGVPTVELKWHPQPLTPDWFSTSIIGVDLTLSRSIFDCVEGIGWLDEENFLIFRDYRRDTSDELRRCTIAGDFLGEAFDKNVREEMCIAFARHCAISRFDEEIFTFFDGDNHSGDESISSI